ncbi:MULTISPECIES: DUF397 domain-containing protein [unclassified Streptomyces]|uniref:DUF397 domain-containing protein n=1 Tax=unclassified Streptomyces TaxID=2593676 RepID=UPI00093C85BA|nr:DUF397 domain-containing protein [Streptomyces sp. TSRI0281]OKI48110.1 DUF397 domain-containing protein [Streptomyces sp. TSRI0281]
MIRKPPAGAAYALEWFKSSYSDSSNSNECVEVASTPEAVHVRDSKDVQGPRLAVTSAAWVGFVSYAAGH